MPDPINDRPTQEELKAGIDAALEDEDPQNPPNDNPENSEDDLPKNPPADGEDSEEEELDDEEGEEEGDEESTPPTKPKEDEKPPVDFEKRYKDSSREAHILAEGKQKLEEEIDEAQNIPTPTEDELREDLKKDGIELDDLSAFEKKLAIESLHQKNINNKVKEIRNRTKADEERVEQRTNEVETFAIHPDTLKRFPKLEGKQDDFIAYATKPSRLVLDLEDLAKLFIIDLPEPKKNKGKMFEIGTGGPNDKPKQRTGIITDPDIAETLRQNDFKKYTNLLKAGKIQIAVE